MIMSELSMHLHSLSQDEADSDLEDEVEVPKGKRKPVIDVDDD